MSEVILTDANFEQDTRGFLGHLVWAVPHVGPGGGRTGK